MATSVTAADSVADLLQNLQVDPQATIRDPSEVQPSESSETQESGLDPTVSTAADTSSVPAGYGGIDSGMYYTLNGYPAHHGYIVGGYDYPVDWDDYSRHMGPEGGDSQNPQGGFSDNGALVYHPSGYAYTAQHLFASYSAGAPIRGDAHLYGAHGYPYAGHLYQQSVPSSAPFIPTSTVETSTGTTRESTSDQQSSNSATTGNSGQSGTRPSHVGYPSGLYGRGVLPTVSVQTSIAQDARANYDSNRIAATAWADSSKSNDVQQRQNTISMGHNIRPLPPLIPHVSPNQHRPRIGIAPTTGGFGRVYQPAARMYSATSDPRRLGIAPGWEPRGSGRNWYPFEKEKPWGRGNGMLNNGNPSWDALNEQNRGPRTTRGRYQRSNSGSVRYVRTQGSTSAEMPNKDQYNCTDFVCTYEKAKFFIIKSYSEDDIHMSIKYNVWASTANGNKKLDVAFQEGQSLAGKYPVFLFFSVNASGQFCGVAEMVGPVDFNKTMDFWQQDKWTGKVPLKWHIVKDVPNSQFRHIILENNDNKPVTNSRDTQEVPLKQGLEMLNIFKNYNMKTSILDDFHHYEARQKLIQDKRTKQHAFLQHQQIVQRVNKDADQRPPQDDVSRNVHDIEVSGKNGSSQKSTDGVDSLKVKTTNMSLASASSKESTLLQAVAEISLVSKSSQK